MNETRCPTKRLNAYVNIGGSLDLDKVDMIKDYNESNKYV